MKKYHRSNVVNPRNEKQRCGKWEKDNVCRSFDVPEVVNGAQKLPGGKATGPDGIFIEYLKIAFFSHKVLEYMLEESKSS